MRPVFITRESLAATAAARWREQYPKRWDGIHAQLVALGPTPSPDDVDAVIGNPSWTNVPRCRGCELDDNTPRVQVGAEPDYDSPTTYLCRACVTDALAAFGGGA